MSASASQRVRGASARVALSATGIVAIAYAVVALVVLLIVSHNLTGQVDNRLSDALARLTGQASPYDQYRQFIESPSDEPRFNAPLLVWTVHPDGTVLSVDGTTLPPQYTHVTNAQDASIGNVDMRVAGESVGNSYVVVGTSLDSVSQALSTLILAEILVAPVLLGVVFLGSFAVGRRVAAPIEAARQRQLEFTADASHELRTPLTVIETQTSLALSQKRTAPWYRAAFERVDVEAHRLRRMVEDLLWLARFDATQRVPQAETIDLVIMVEQVVDRFSPVAASKGQSLTCEVGDAPAMIAASADWIDRLLGVLLDNACRYTPDGGKIRVSLSIADGRVRVRVEDSGPGIAAEERPHIFDRFRRASAAPGGAGLGLAIGNAVVQSTHGHWEIGTSELGGAVLSVSWPAVS